MTITAAQMIDRASTRHWSFPGGINDGAALAFLDEAQRSFLLDLSKTLEALLGETSEIETALSGAFVVAIDENGVPYFTDTTEPGYAIRFDGGVPYIEVGTPIITDPFGSEGDSPGLPMPANLLRLVEVCAMTAQATIVPLPINVLGQEVVRKSPVRTGLQAFLSANRLIPVRTSEGDLWSQVTSVRVSCITCPELTVLSDEITIPTPCLPALTAALAKWMSNQARECPANDKRQFAIDAEKAYDQMLLSVNAMDAVTSSTVLYKR